MHTHTHTYTNYNEDKIIEKKIILDREALSSKEGLNKVLIEFTGNGIGS